jgi:branched-chain amino acid transport system ATP-binding protein
MSQSAVPQRAILAIEGLSKSYGGLRAVAGASFEVRPASITALIGPNGAGKTTLFDLITGFVRPDVGAVRFDDYSIGGVPPHRIARLGLVRTFQLTRVFNAMTVLENMMLAAPRQPGERLAGGIVSTRRSRRRESEVKETALALLGRFNLATKMDDYAATLSGGQRKLLELARALMTTPKLLLLDEPMAGVNRVLGRELLDYVVELRRTEGMTFLFIEHDMDVVMSRADHVVVMAEGSVVTEGPPDVVRADTRVIDAYLGQPQVAK